MHKQDEQGSWITEEKEGLETVIHYMSSRYVSWFVCVPLEGTLIDLEIADCARESL